MPRQKHTMRYWLTEAARLAREFPVLASTLWGVTFLAFFGVLAGVGLVPDALTRGDEHTEANATVVTGPETSGTPVAHAAAADPLHITIDAIGVDAPVLNPESPDTETLDAALLAGAVHYPGSADLEENGNVFLFGHSSYLPKVINPAFRAFNGLQHLAEGDIIRVRSRSDEYIYRVTSVKLVDASEAWVDLSRTGRKLTLSTCDSFGKKQDRFVVEAEFVGSYELSGESAETLDF